MKSLLLINCIILPFLAKAQTPYLSVKLNMDSAKAEGVRYKIEMKICKPKKMTARGDWFTHDTSKINFALLQADEIDCGNYFDKGIGKPLTYNKEEIPFNKFEFSNQSFAWEEIYVFRISNWSSRGWHPEMYIVMPMKYKSFVTYIKLNDIEFQSGNVMFVSDFGKKTQGMSISIEQSLKDHKTEEIKNFSLKELLEEK